MFDLPNLLAGSLLGVIGSVVAGSFIQPIFGEATSYHLVKWLSIFLLKIRREFPLQGLWTQSWTAEDTVNFVRKNSSNLTLYQAGSQIAGDYTAITKSERICTYRLKGHLKNNYLSGTWRDVDNEGYFGSFKIRVSEAKESAEGIWVGSKDNAKISSGLWHWERKKSEK